MPAAPGAPWVLCLGADIEKAGACVAVQCGLSEPVSLGTVTRETVLSPLPVLRARGWHSVLGLEACGFGWRFQRQLREAGAEVLAFATEALTGRRKTNARDAAALARLVVVPAPAHRAPRRTHPQSLAPTGPRGAMPGPGRRTGKSKPGTGGPHGTTGWEGWRRGGLRGENSPAPGPSRRPAPTRHRAPAISQKVESAKGATAGRPV